MDKFPKIHYLNYMRWRVDLFVSIFRQRLERERARYEQSGNIQLGGYDNPAANMYEDMGPTYDLIGTLPRNSQNKYETLQSVRHDNTYIKAT